MILENKFQKTDAGLECYCTVKCHIRKFLYEFIYYNISPVSNIWKDRPPFAATPKFSIAVTVERDIKILLQIYELQWSDLNSYLSYYLFFIPIKTATFAVL
jgi:hypothetical protein